MLLQQVQVDDNVVEVCNAELIQVLARYRVNMALKGRKSIDKTK